MPSRKLALSLLLFLLIAGVVAATVYGLGRAGAIAASPVSAVIAVVCLGIPLAAGLCLLFGDTLRLLIPARYERFNLELARYRKSLGSEPPTEEGLRYVSAWRDLHRRVSLLLCLFALALVPALSRLPRAGAMIAMMVWAAAVVVLVVWQRAFRCPRCAERFQGERRTRLAPPFCTHCGLPRDSTSATAVSPEFDTWKQMSASTPAASATSRYKGRTRR
jgi:hypothetical protein